MASDIKHIPVLLKPLEVLLRELVAHCQASELFGLDATLGSAGHTLAILDLLPSRMVGIDQDAKAIDRVEARLTSLGKAELLSKDLLRLKQASFTNAPPCPWAADGYHFILADLGYSSDQLEGADYGLSFQKESPLNMQLTQDHDGAVTGHTAWEILTESSEEGLAAILHHYGEIPGSRRLARAIQAGIADGKIENSTLSLASFLEKFLGFGPSKRGKSPIHPATKTFQALRIAANDELRKLDQFLTLAPTLLRTGGLLLLITFHSLEDRIVKKHFSSIPALKKQKIMPEDSEIQENPRSRSAKLRVLWKG